MRKTTRRHLAVASAEVDVSIPDHTNVLGRLTSMVAMARATNCPPIGAVIGTKDYLALESHLGPPSPGKNWQAHDGINLIPDPSSDEGIHLIFPRDVAYAMGLRRLAAE